MKYIDILHPPEDEQHRHFIERIKAGEFFYPVVLVNGELAGEGNPRLKTVYQLLEKYGIS